jgi:hypothetical protein
VRWPRLGPAAASLRWRAAGCDSGVDQGADGYASDWLGLFAAVASTWVALVAVIEPVCTENLIRVDAVMESPKLAE